MTIFRGDTVNTLNVNYQDRAWEKEAFKKGEILKNVLENR